MSSCGEAVGAFGDAAPGNAAGSSRAAVDVHADACRAAKDCDDSTSTAASEVGDCLADLVDSDDGEAAQEQQPASSGSSCSPAASAPAPKVRWADLADSDAEDDLAPLPLARPRAEEARVAEKPSAAPTRREARPPAGKSQQQLRWRKREAGEDSPSSECSEAPQERRPARSRKEAAQWQHEAAWWEWEQSEWWGSKGDSRWSSKQDWWSQQRYDSWSASKMQCQFYIGIEEDAKFKVTRKILGPHGQHMKSIAEASGAKLRLRGRGSGFLEGAEQRESSDELMLCVSSTDQAGYDEARRLVQELLERVYKEYRTFCRKAGWSAGDLRIHVHDGPRPGSRWS